ncbi:LOW QUALITY PROTEIN: hypothetical protein CVT26_009046, partial [Gymnopilus dilepis]
ARSRRHVDVLVGHPGHRFLGFAHHRPTRRDGCEPAGGFSDVESLSSLCSAKAVKEVKEDGTRETKEDEAKANGNGVDEANGEMRLAVLHWEEIPRKGVGRADG